MLLQAAASDTSHESNTGSLSDATDAADPESVPASETVAAQAQPSQRLVHYLRYLQAIHAATAHLSYVLEHRAQHLATTQAVSATARLAAAGRGKARPTSKRDTPGSADPAAPDAAKPPAKRTRKSANTTD